MSKAKSQPELTIELNMGIKTNCYSWNGIIIFIGKEERTWY